jgi:hypothetical protein
MNTGLKPRSLSPGLLSQHLIARQFLSVTARKQLDADFAELSSNYRVWS